MAGLAGDPGEAHSGIANVIRSHMAGFAHTPEPGAVAAALHRRARSEAEKAMLRPVLRQMDRYGGPPVEAFTCCIEEGLSVGELLGAMADTGVRNERLEEGARRLSQGQGPDG